MITNTDNDDISWTEYLLMFPDSSVAYLCSLSFQRCARECQRVTRSDKVLLGNAAKEISIKSQANSYLFIYFNQIL